MVFDFISDVISPDFLRDESRRSGRAAALALPQSEAELASAMVAARERGWCVTVQGGRTGLTGGAVPDGGLIVNVSRMNRVTGLRQRAGGGFILMVQPGLLLQDLNRMLDAREFDTTGWSVESLAAWDAFRSAPSQFFPPDPTETTATLGGMAACNASGACTFQYGAMRRHVAGLRLMLADGDVITLRRGSSYAQGRRFELESDGGRRLAGSLPDYTMPDTKNAAGYYSSDDMDLVDLFVGSEGTLGLITELELQLTEKPAVLRGLLSFSPDLSAAVRFVVAARAAVDRHLASLEFFDERSLSLLRAKRGQLEALSALPELPIQGRCAVYVEIHAAVEDCAANSAERLMACGAQEEAVWLATTARDMEKFKAFRHALPEAVNNLIDERRKTEPALTKLGTDMAVPDAHLVGILDRYIRDLHAAGLDYVIFGHIGNNHLHVNILPRSLAEYQQGLDLYWSWAREVVRLGGTVAAEHGIGKIKTPMLDIQYGSHGMEQMCALKRIFDPDLRLNPGNLFSA